jgi:uncharacterized protein (DUF433 family)
MSDLSGEIARFENSQDVKCSLLVKFSAWRMHPRRCILGKSEVIRSQIRCTTHRAKGEQSMFDRITFDSQIMGGRACIRGMRIPVSVIVGQVAHGATFDEILQGYPDLERDDIQQAMEYAAWLTQEEIHFC